MLYMKNRLKQQTVHNDNAPGLDFYYDKKGRLLTLVSEPTRVKVEKHSYRTYEEHFCICLTLSTKVGTATVINTAWRSVAGATRERLLKQYMDLQVEPAARIHLVGGDLGESMWLTNSTGHDAPDKSYRVYGDEGVTVLSKITGHQSLCWAAQADFYCVHTLFPLAQPLSQMTAQC